MFNEASDRAAIGQHFNGIIATQRDSQSRAPTISIAPSHRSLCAIHFEFASFARKPRHCELVSPVILSVQCVSALGTLIDLSRNNCHTIGYSIFASFRSLLPPCPPQHCLPSQSAITARKCKPSTRVCPRWTLSVPRSHVLATYHLHIVALLASNLVIKFTNCVITHFQTFPWTSLVR